MIASAEDQSPAGSCLGMQAYCEQGTGSLGATQGEMHREDWSLFSSRFPGKNFLPSIGLEVSDKSLQAVSDSC